MLIIAGIAINAFDGKIIPSVIGMILGTAVCYVLGTIWFCISADYNMKAALAICVIPFLPGDAIKIMLAAIIGPQLQKRLRKL